MTDATVSAKIPANMAMAILAAQNEMPNLRKADTNKYGGYAYVSIDDYLDAIPKIAAKHGLFWITREAGDPAIGEKTAAYRYAMDLFFKDGSCLPEYCKITVIHPIQGAQTSGSAMAYAEKMMTRFAFKVVTGEQDADATNPHGEPGGPQAKAEEARPRAPLRTVHAAPLSLAEAKEKGLIPKGEVIGGIAKGGVSVTEEAGIPIVKPPANPNGWKDVAAVFTTFVDQCDNPKTLEEFWAENINTLDKIKVQDEDLYKTVKKAFAARKKAITAKEKA